MIWKLHPKCKQSKFSFLFLICRKKWVKIILLFLIFFLNALFRNVSVNKVAKSVSIVNTWMQHWDSWEGLLMVHQNYLLQCSKWKLLVKTQSCPLTRIGVNLEHLNAGSDARMTSMRTWEMLGNNLIILFSTLKHWFVPHHNNTTYA